MCHVLSCHRPQPTSNLCSEGLSQMVEMWTNIIVSGQPREKPHPEYLALLAMRSHSATAGCLLESLDSLPTATPIWVSFRMSMVRPDSCPMLLRWLSTCMPKTHNETQLDPKESEGQKQTGHSFCACLVFALQTRDQYPQKFSNKRKINTKEGTIVFFMFTASCSMTRRL